VRLISCVGQLQSPCLSASLCELSPERFGVDVVRENPLAVDLDHRQPLAVARLELWVAGDVDLLQLEAFLAAQLGQLHPGAFAEVAVGGVVEGDPGYGYKPRVVVASATRWTASP
jgi:hypothetical protein